MNAARGRTVVAVGRARFEPPSLPLLLPDGGVSTPEDIVSLMAVRVAAVPLLPAEQAGAAARQRVRLR